MRTYWFLVAIERKAPDTQTPPSPSPCVALSGAAPAICIVHGHPHTPLLIHEYPGGLSISSTFSTTQKRVLSKENSNVHRLMNSTCAGPAFNKNLESNRWKMSCVYHGWSWDIRCFDVSKFWFTEVVSEFEVWAHKPIRVPGAKRRKEKKK